MIKPRQDRTPTFNSVDDLENVVEINDLSPKLFEKKSTGPEGETQEKQQQAKDLDESVIKYDSIFSKEKDAAKSNSGPILNRQSSSTVRETRRILLIKR